MSDTKVGNILQCKITQYHCVVTNVSDNSISIMFADGSADTLKREEIEQFIDTGEKVDLSEPIIKLCKMDLKMDVKGEE